MADKQEMLPEIYIPCPPDVDQESDPPRWHKYFDPDELKGRYEPIREIGKFCVPQYNIKSYNYI